MPLILSLERPLAILDLETTGVAPDVDRIIEIAILKVMPDGSKTHYVQRFNPQILIPPESIEVHGITDEDVRDEPTFPDIAQKVANFLNDCDIAGFNVTGFDLRMLETEFLRAEVEFSIEGRSIIDAQRIFHIQEPRDLSAAVRFYLDADHEGAHSALEDARMTWQVLKAQLERYPDLPRDPSGLHEFCKPPSDRYVDSERKFEWRHGQAAFAFGKYRGKLLEEVVQEDPAYLQWMCGDRANFPAETKRIVSEALEGTFPTREIKPDEQ